jgi:hypothetical protein
MAAWMKSAVASTSPVALDDLAVDVHDQEIAGPEPRPVDAVGVDEEAPWLDLEAEVVVDRLVQVVADRETECRSQGAALGLAGDAVVRWKSPRFHRHIP